MSTLAKKEGIEFYFGLVPFNCSSEEAETIRKHHYADRIKRNRQKTLEEKIDRLNALKSAKTLTPKKFIYNQKIKSA